MNRGNRSGKAPTWLLALGGLLMAAVGPWGATTLWQTCNRAPSQGTPSDASSQGANPNSHLADLAKDSLNPLGLAPSSTPNPDCLGGRDVSRSAEGGNPPVSGDPAAHFALAEPTSPGQKSFSFDEIFRFDLTIREVFARWPRVSSSLAELQLQGYRVPLVTGAAETDLAGALTYYFNSYQQLQRISFQGTTGDGRELVQFLTSRYGFQRRLTNDPSLFIYEVPRLGGPPQSILRMKLAPTLKADQPHQRFEVWLVIERPEEATSSFWQPGGRK